MNISILKQKNFSMLMLGKLVSLIGTSMQSFVLSLYVLQITGSAVKFASVLSIAIIPELILSPFAGVLVDWLDKKKLLVYMDILSGTVIGLFAYIAINSNGLSLFQIYILVIILSLISVIYNPTIRTIIPSIMEKKDLMDANGVNSIISNLGELIAPTLGAVLFQIYGLFPILLINSISFILSAISETFIDIPKIYNKPEKITIKSFNNNFQDGIRFIKGKKMLLTILIIGIIVNAIGGPIYSVGLTYISKEVLKVTDLQYGILNSVLVISMLIAPFICSMVCKKSKLGKILFVEIIISSALLELMAFVCSPFYLNLFNSNFIPYINLIIILVFDVLITSIGSIVLTTMLQEEVPKEFMGRVFAVMSTLIMIGTPLGQMIFGVLFDKIDAWICVSIAAILLFSTVLGFRRSLLGTKDTNLLAESKS